MWARYDRKRLREKLVVVGGALVAVVVLVVLYRALSAPSPSDYARDCAELSETIRGSLGWAVRYPDERRPACTIFMGSRGVADLGLTSFCDGTTTGGFSVGFVRDGGTWRPKVEEFRQDYPECPPAST